ncbi:MAG: hypothetical protein ACFFCS_26330 [Candidatus Hodarchaeota archaeon]
MIPDWFYKDDAGDLLQPLEISWRIAQFGIIFILSAFGIYFLLRYFKSKKNNPIQAPFNRGYTIFFLHNL